MDLGRASGCTHEISELRVKLNFTYSITFNCNNDKPKIQSLKRESDDLKRKLETLTKDFNELKDLLEKKETTARARQDGGSSSPNRELQHSQQFLSDEYDDMQGKLSKLGTDLLNLSVKVNEITDAVEALQQYIVQLPVQFKNRWLPTS